MMSGIDRSYDDQESDETAGEKLYMKMRIIIGHVNGLH